MLKRLLTMGFVLAMFAVMPLSAASVEGIIMDNMCMGKFKDNLVDEAKTHTKDCALMDACKASGYAIIQSDGTVVKLDEKGNELAVTALEGTSKEKDLQVKAEGELSDGTLAVTSLSLI